MNIVLILEKCETKASCRRPCFASAWNCNACTVVRCGRTDLIDLFPAAFVNSQIAQVESPRILERVVPVQVRSAAKSSLCNFTSFFLLKIEDLENSKSFRSKGWLFTPNNACSGGRYPTSERPRSLSRQNNLGRYLARTTLRHNV